MWSSCPSSYVPNHYSGFLSTTCKPLLTQFYVRRGAVCSRTMTRTSSTALRAMREWPASCTSLSTLKLCRDLTPMLHVLTTPLPHPTQALDPEAQLRPARRYGQGLEDHQPADRGTTTWDVMSRSDPLLTTFLFAHNSRFRPTTLARCVSTSRRPPSPAWATSTSR
jgi:hypothetical protein